MNNYDYRNVNSLSNILYNPYANLQISNYCINTLGIVQNSPKKDKEYKMIRKRKFLEI